MAALGVGELATSVAGDLNIIIRKCDPDTNFDWFPFNVMHAFKNVRFIFQLCDLEQLCPGREQELAKPEGSRSWGSLKLPRYLLA